MCMMLCLSNGFSADSAKSKTVVKTNVQVKSKLNKTKDKVLVQINLPNQEEVFFSLEDTFGITKHLWKKKALESGNHELGLPLPKLAKGKYLLQIHVGAETFKHLVYLPKPTS